MTIHIVHEVDDITGERLTRYVTADPDLAERAAHALACHGFRVEVEDHDADGVSFEEFEAAL